MSFQPSECELCGGITPFCFCGPYSIVPVLWNQCVEELGPFNALEADHPFELSWEHTLVESMFLVHGLSVSQLETYLALRPQFETSSPAELCDVVTALEEGCE